MGAGGCCSQVCSHHLSQVRLPSCPASVLFAIGKECKSGLAYCTGAPGGLGVITYTQGPVCGHLHSVTSSHAPSSPRPHLPLASDALISSHQPAAHSPRPNCCRLLHKAGIHPLQVKPFSSEFLQFAIFTSTLERDWSPGCFFLWNLRK